MDTGIQSTKGFCKSLCGAVGLFALTVYGMAEMTGLNSSSSSSSQQATAVAQPALGGASARQAGATTIGAIGNTVAVTTVPAATASNTDYVVELSASASNSQMPSALQSLSLNINTSVGVNPFVLSREGDAFKLQGTGVFGLGYILEGSSDLKNWFAIARNLPMLETMEIGGETSMQFDIRPDIRADFAFLRVRTEQLSTAVSVNVADMILADYTPTPAIPPAIGNPDDPIDTNPGQPAVTGILGSSGGQ